MKVSPVPQETILASSGLMTRPWLNWLQRLLLKVNGALEQIGLVSVSAQSASIATTAIDVGTLSDGRYTVTHYARITQAAAVNSSLTVTIGWTDGGVACSQSYAALTGNTTSTTQSGSVTVQADGGSSLTYATAYVSVGAPSMLYTLSVVAEARP